MSKQMLLSGLLSDFPETFFEIPALKLAASTSLLASRQAPLTDELAREGYLFSLQICPLNCMVSIIEWFDVKDLEKCCSASTYSSTFVHCLCMGTALFNT